MNQPPPAEGRIRVDSRRSFGPHHDQVIAELAGRQQGAVSRQQLVALGISNAEIDRRIRSGYLHVVHAGVYAVGHRLLSQRGRWMAAVLTSRSPRVDERGDRFLSTALLSHRHGAGLHQLVKSWPSRVDVTVSDRCGRAIPGLHVHRPRFLNAADLDVVDGIPCTSVSRTLLDLATQLRPRQLERACDEAEFLRVFDLDAVRDVLRRNRGARGAGRLRQVLAIHDVGSTLTRSPLEELFLEIFRNGVAERPLVNQTVEIAPGEFITVDFCWPAARLIVEVDGRRSHERMRVRIDDEKRDCAVKALGWTPLRYTEWDGKREPNRVLTEVNEILHCRGTTLRR